jgi:plasmid segregation protein ParM
MNSAAHWEAALKAAGTTPPESDYSIMAKRPVKQQPTGVLNVGMDIGYGVLKAITPDQVIAFPSVMGAGHDFSFKADEITQRYPGMQLHDAGAHLFVGDLALSQLRPHQQRRLLGRTANETEIGMEFRRRLMLVAIGRIAASMNVSSGDVLHVRLATGLPVDHMADAQTLKEALIGQHVLETDQVSVVVNVTEVMCMPQPYGAIYSKWLTEAGAINACYTWNRTAVIDIGTYTIDAAVDDDGEFVPRESASIEGGLWTAQETISQLIEADQREKPGYRMVEQVLRTGRVTIKGKTVDLSREVAAAIQPIEETVLNLCAGLWKGGMNQDVIWAAGGGAPFVFRAIQEYFPHAHLLDESYLANARGYLNYAHSVQSAG